MSKAYPYPDYSVDDMVGIVAGFQAQLEDAKRNEAAAAQRRRVLERQLSDAKAGLMNARRLASLNR